MIEIHLNKGFFFKLKGGENLVQVVLVLFPIIDF